MIIRSAADLNAEAEQATRIAAELRRQATIAAKAERDARRPAMPPVDDEPVFVTFGRLGRGRSYAFAAVGFRVGEHVRWAVTGTESRQFNWPMLLGFVGEANWETLQIVTARMRLIDPDDLPPAAERLSGHGHREQVEPYHGKAHDSGSYGKTW